MTKPRLPAVFNLVSFDSVGSTNAEAHKLARQGEGAAPDGTVVWALEQTEGRGRRSRAWETPRGNFSASFILRPECPLPEAAQLSFVAGLAVFDALGAVGEPGHQVSMKWPNDVLLNERKVAGLLLEAEGGDAETPADYLVLGIGINLIHHPADTEFKATSLAAEQMGHVEPGEMLQSLCKAIPPWVEIWLEDGGFGKIRKTWLWRAGGKGKTIRVRLDGETVEGVFHDIDETGALVLKMAGTTRTVTAGDVYFPALAEA